MNPRYLIIKARDRVDDTSKQFTIPNPAAAPVPSQANNFLTQYDAIYGTQLKMTEMYIEERVKTPIYPEP